MSLKRLVFPVPASLKAWAKTQIDGGSACDAAQFQGYDGSTADSITNFVLFAYPGEYRPIIQEQVPRKHILGFGAPVVNGALHRVGFEYSTDNGNQIAPRFLQQLAVLANANTNSYLAVTVLDYCQVEVADVVQGYTVRSMHFNSAIVPKSGLYGNLTDGFDFSMMEIEPRYRY